MVLWTIQPVEVYKQIKRDGYYKFNSALAENYKDFKNSYDWLERQMNIRGINKNNCEEGLVWAWYKWNGIRKNPDLKESGFAESGEKMVCMEIDIPDNRVLLSDFDAWHYVLNDWWIDDSTNEKEWDENHKWLDTLRYAKQREIREKSWQKIFDIEELDTEWVKKGFYVQATFYGLELKDIKKIQYFTCK
jgi:hypothetical protein